MSMNSLLNQTKFSKQQLHLLALPQEVRDCIYGLMRKDILQKRLSEWFQRPKTAYDGLKYTCAQLYHETVDRLFMFTTNKTRATNLVHLPSNRIVLNSTRSLSLEIEFEQLRELYRGLAHTLDTLQLSLQELRLSFTGNDRNGKKVWIHGCGKLTPDTSDSLQGTLSATGQYTHTQLGLLHLLTILRNLRVLVIKNANMPLFQSMIIQSKPHLQALQVITDPRSTVHQYEKFLGKSMLLNGLLTDPMHNLAPVKALYISANAALLSCNTTVKIMPTLEHLTYTTPAYEQVSSTFDCPLLGHTAHVISMLRSRAPNLKTFRLCIGGTIRDSVLEMGQIMESLRYDLFSTKIQNLELHLSVESKFFPNELLDGLPPTLKRLYLSDCTLTTDQLTANFYLKYLSSYEYKVLLRCPFYCETTPTDRSAENLDSRHHGIVGELRHRQDLLMFSHDDLGFISFEFNELGDDSHSLKLLKMNGRLLDREQNLHLRSENISSSLAGIQPRMAKKSEKRIYETDMYSENLAIACAVFNLSELRSHPKRVKDIVSEFEMCGLSKDHWYFGSEDEAEKVFADEAVAKIEDQRSRSYPAIVEVETTDKCRWMAPEYKVPPVGSWPEPPKPLPEDY